MTLTQIKFLYELPVFWIWVVALVLIISLFITARFLRSRFPLISVLLRILLFALIFLIILTPMIEKRLFKKGKPEIAVVIDNSGSMGTVDPQTKTRRIDFVAALLKKKEWQELSRQYHLRYFAFADTVTPMSPDQLKNLAIKGQSTLILEALSALKSQFRKSPVNGLVLISDGLDTEWGRRDQTPAGSPSPLETGLEKSTPVNTIFVSDQAGRDIAISKVLYHPLGFTHHPVEIEVYIQSVGHFEERIPVSLYQNGKLIEVQALNASGDGTRQMALFKVRPKQPGPYLYEAVIPRYPGELSHKNNQYLFSIQIERDKIRVLHVCGTPSWDVRFLRSFLKRYIKIDLISFFILRTMESIQMAADYELSLIQFPTKELFDDQLHTFDLVIFQNFTFKGFGISHYLSNVAQFVEKGGGFLMLGGEQSFTSGGYYNTPIMKILPVKLLPPEKKELISAAPFNMALTEEGLNHPIFSLSLNDSENRAFIAKLPQLQGLNLLGAPQPNGLTLAAHPEIKIDNRPVPVIAIAEVKKGRTMILASDSFWQWQYQAGEGEIPAVYEPLLKNALAWLTFDPRMNLIKISPRKKSFAEGEPAVVLITVYNSSFKPAEKASCQIQVKTARDKIVHQQNYQTSAKGQLQITLSLQPGAYFLVATARLNEVEHRSQAPLIVQENTEEQRRVIPTNVLLKAISKSTGGNYMEMKDRLKFQVNEAVEPGVAATEYTELLNSAIFFALLILLLAADWYFRSRKGEF